MKLHEDSRFKEIVKECSENISIRSEYVEKDYWVISVLKGIMTSDPKFVFKGGTSLSKCHHVINRFSEDIDISYSDEDITKSHRRRLIAHIIDSVEHLGLEIANRDQIRSGRLFNRLSVPYTQLFASTTAKPVIEIELANQTSSFPYEVKTVQTYIGEYLAKIGRDDLVEQFDLQPFEVNVQTLDRTFIDKVFALCDYYLEGKTEKHSRHVYDLNQIIRYVEFDDSLLELLDKVRSIRAESPVCPSAKEGMKLGKIFSEIVNKEIYKDDYNKTTYPLLYDKVDYEECEVSLALISSFLNRNDK